MRQRTTVVLAGFCFVCAAVTAGDLWNGIQPGPYGAGFRLERTMDPTRNTTSTQAGTELGLAIWFPTRVTTSRTRAMSQLDYRLLGFSESVSVVAREEFLNSEAEMMVAWRHVGIVPLTLGQARMAIKARGRAIPNAPPVPGKFPVVIILGGPFYLSTTAEILASHGYFVVAPLRFSDQSNEISTFTFSWSMENSVRDAEWALSEVRRHSNADMSHISAIGHGGGGMQALLLAMRNRNVGAVVNIDAGNFSKRSDPQQLIFYHSRLLRAPYLFIATAATRRDLDQFDQFEKMKFSRRYEVILRNAVIQHHDLSDIGRGVTSMGIRGEAQDSVQRTYAAVQEMLVRFLDCHDRPRAAENFGPWFEQLNTSEDYEVSIRESVEPAPTAASVVHNIQAVTMAQLKDAYKRDPEAPLFGEDEIRKVAIAARHKKRAQLAAEVAQFGLDLYPESPAIHQLASSTLEASGDLTGARTIAVRCASLPANDWRARSAQSECRERAARLQK